MRRINNVFGVVFLLCCATGSAQTLLNAPYSRFGVGEIGSRTAAANAAMGGTSLAFQSATVVNFANPASYIAYDSLACLFDAAFTYKNHTLTTNASEVQKGNCIVFDYLALGLSVAKWWKTSFGFQPFSTMSYTINQVDNTLDTNAITTSFFGEGGINEFYWGNAFKLFNNFSIGFNASYLFGEYNRNRKVESSDILFVNSQTSNSNLVKGFSLTLGMQYFVPIKEKGNLGFGLVYTPAIPIYADIQNQTVTYFGTGYNPTKLEEEPLYSTRDKNAKLSMPQSIGGGISWGNGLNYFVGADFTWTNWANYAVNGINDSLINSYKIAVGGNYIPNPTSTKFFSRIVFSLGANYEQTYLKLNDFQLDKLGMNFGLQFPVKRSKTSFGAIFEYGQMGTTESGLIKEDYFKITISIRVHEPWYQRKKLE
ncbi:MAG: hypothetical protein FWH36_00130 [Lentimicrobiaceae bacterium]|nr:hypothetical protein [Lentimicrobiaceae bacterium]